MRPEPGDRTIVIALGGNAILQPRQKGTLAEQQANIAIACDQIAAIIRVGHRVILTHGNGPQVGNILLQNEEARAVVPPMPLDVCGAQSQGMLGYLLQQELQRQTGLPAVTLITRVLVDSRDPAFASPSKPVGPFYTPDRARRLMDQEGWAMKEDAGRGWRRVVPSPKPVQVVEAGAIRTLVDRGLLVIASGGGGVPVVAAGDGLWGVDAVIDKDLAAALLARTLGADLLVILTDVPQVCIRYRQPDQQMLDRISVAEAERYIAEGHFHAGSMLPKVAAAVSFVREDGGRAVIGSLEQAADAVRGVAGTQFTQ